MQRKLNSNNWKEMKKIFKNDSSSHSLISKLKH